MNIRDEGMWPTEELPFNRRTFREMVTRRRKTLKGFMDREQEKGVARFGMSISTPQGQDVARLFMFRTLEELTEAYDSVEDDHRLEELIDAINYLWAIILFDTSLITSEEFADQMYNIVARYWNYMTPEPLMMPASSIGELDPGSLASVKVHLTDVVTHSTLRLGRVTDTFRNRSWMANAQDVYFSGRTVLIEAVKSITLLIISQFTTYDQFVHFWIAKDNVLQFRLKTNY